MISLQRKYRLNILLSLLLSGLLVLIILRFEKVTKSINVNRQSTKQLHEQKRNSGFEELNLEGIHDPFGTGQEYLISDNPYKPIRPKSSKVHAISKSPDNNPVGNGQVISMGRIRKDSQILNLFLSEDDMGIHFDRNGDVREYHEPDISIKPSSIDE